MDITQLAQKPQLVEVILDKPELVEKHGDTVVFYTWDRVNTDQFVKLASVEENSGPAEMVSLLKDFILDAQGNPVLADGQSLPMDILVAALEQISTRLGKF